VSARLALRELALPGLFRATSAGVGDARGSFSRLFEAEVLAAAGWRGAVAQVNLSRSARRGTVRGLHFQRVPHADRKLVMCVRGAVFDVAVDLRRGSPTFGRWHGEELVAESGGGLMLPEGFAHGFQALTDDAELVYCHSAAYVPDAEGGVHPLDATLRIDWPLPPVHLSRRDESLPGLGAASEGIGT
jgi:dTDP-4-dehydrorhamnose 3,5-epimerase